MNEQKRRQNKTTKHCAFSEKHTLSETPSFKHSLNKSSLFKNRIISDWRNHLELQISSNKSNASCIAFNFSSSNNTYFKRLYITFFIIMSCAYHFSQTCIMYRIIMIQCDHKYHSRNIVKCMNWVFVGGGGGGVWYTKQKPHSHKTKPTCVTKDRHKKHTLHTYFTKLHFLRSFRCPPTSNIWNVQSRSTNSNSTIPIHNYMGYCGVCVCDVTHIGSRGEVETQICTPTTQSCDCHSGPRPTHVS